jgi:hypothetical protein
MIRSALLLFISLVSIGSTGCSSSPFHSSEDPFGMAVVAGGAHARSNFQADAKVVDVKSGVKVANDRELLPVFVQEPIVDASALRGINNFDEASFSRLTRRSTEEALAGFGRFAVVPSKEQAMLIVEPRVIAVIPWKDSVTREDGFDVEDAVSGEYASTSSSTRVQREGVDVSISLSFFRSDGAIIANERATGRLSSSKGDLIQDAEGSVDRYAANGSQFQKLDHAEMDHAKLTEVVNDTTRGVVVLMLKQFDERWWSKDRNAYGQKPLDRDRLAAASTAP